MSPHGRPKGEAGVREHEGTNVSVPAPVIASGWQALRRFTAARIALGRAGVSQPTTAHLEFQLAHASARDAVHLPFDGAGVAAAIEALGLATLRLHSAASDRHLYLQRPDLGRRLDEASKQRLTALRGVRPTGAPFDVAIVVADGLSALAVHRHAAALVAALLPRARDDGWKLAPVVVVDQGRVAIGDEVGELLDSKVTVVLLGERPGLSSPDSLGVYFTWAPRVGLTDASRNCISNVRPEGLPVETAATKLHLLLREALRRKLSGIDLKDETETPASAVGGSRNFLLAGPDD